MKIAVCMKFGLDADEIKVDPETLELRMNGVPRKFGDYDYNALTEAARLGEEMDATVHIIVFGPEGAREGLKEAIAMGADRATVVIDPSGGAVDTMMSVEVIARTIEEMGGFDLVICGEASIDGASYQFVPRLAQRLSYACLPYVNRLSIEGQRLSVDRNIAERSETLNAPFPAVISVTAESNVPSKPTLMQILKAKEKEIAVWTLEENIGMGIEELESASVMPLVERSGVIVKRKEVIFKDLAPVDAAQALLDKLEGEGVLGNE